MTKFYLFDKKKRDWICKKQVKTTVSLARIEQFTFHGDDVSYKIETTNYDIDKDILQVYLR